MGNAQKKNELKKNEDDASYLDELKPGTELLQGQYKIVEFLNSGGFGITYLATDSLERKVVIKECFPSSFCHRSRAIVQARSRAHSKELTSIVNLFVQEARSLAKLDHPNIVGVHQVFEDNQTAYMVLDFVEGRDLLDTLEDENHGLTAPQIKGILKDILGAVQFIHDQDILHRDISPDNILIDSDLRPVLIDFGAAREEATKQSRVLSALRVVKDGYSPQEFYVQGSEQSPSSDLYALGATFYHLIAGEVPVNSQARLAAIASEEKDPYVPLVERAKGFDRKLLESIDKSLGILPKDRIQSANAWLDMIEGRRRPSKVVSTVAPISSAAAASDAANKKSPLVLLMGSAAALAIIAVVGLVATGTLNSAGEEEIAQTEEVISPEETEAIAAADAAAAVAAAEAEALAAVEAEALAAEVAEAARLAEIEAAEAEAEAARLAEIEAEEAEVVRQAEIEAEAERLAEIAVAEAEAKRLAEVAEAEAEAARLAEIEAAEAEALRVAEAEAAEIEAARLAEIAEAEAEAARLEQIAAAEAEAEQQAAIAAAEAEAARLAEVAAAEAEAERLAEIAAAEVEAEAQRLAEIAAAEEMAVRLAEIEAAEAEAAEVAKLGARIPQQRNEQSAANYFASLLPPVLLASVPNEPKLPRILNIFSRAPQTVDSTTADTPLGTRKLSAPSQENLPELDLTAPGKPTEAATFATVTNFGSSNVLSAWSVELPFAGGANSNKITEVDFVSPAWAEIGAEIVAVNGTPISKISDINGVLRATIDPGDSLAQRLTFSVKPANGGEVADHEWELPIMQDTILLNGLEFATRFDGEAWKTVVTSVPDAKTDLKEGDVLVALMSTSEPVDGRTSLTDLLTRELENGASEFSFAVSREGSMWIASMTYFGGA